MSGNMTIAPIKEPICILLPHQNNARYPWLRIIVQMDSLIKLIRIPLTMLTKICKEKTVHNICKKKYQK